jgi:hypothetical protein
VVKPGGSSLPDSLMASRGAYIFFAVVGWLIAMIFFFLNILNIIMLGFLHYIPWTIIVIIFLINKKHFQTAPKGFCKKKIF